MLNLKDMSKKAEAIALGVGVAVLLTAAGMLAYNGPAPKVLVEGDYIEAQQGGSLGAASFVTPGSNFTDLKVENDFIVDGDSEFNGSVQFDGATAFTVVSTSTSATAMTLQESDLGNTRYVSVTPNTADLTYTFPSTSTLTSFLQTAGYATQIVFKNVTTTAGIEVILSPGTGFDFDNISTSTRRINPGASLSLFCIREVDTDITCQNSSSID